MFKLAKYALGATAVAAWLAFALSPKDGPRPQPGAPQLDHAPLSVRPLDGEVILRRDELGLPARIEVVGEHLVIVDRGGGPSLHALHRPSGRFASFGRAGEGPGEFTGPWGLDPVPGRSSVWVFDIALQRLTRVDLGPAGPVSALRESPTVRFRSPAPVTGAVRLEEGGWLAAGLFPDGRLGRFDDAGRYLGARGRVPGSGPELPSELAQHAYHGPVAVRPDRRRVALASLRAGRIEIHDPATGAVRLAAVPFAFEPRVGVRERRGRPTLVARPDVRYGYVGLAAGPERLYALFSGRTPGGHERPSSGEHVHVFDWDGRFLEALGLRADALALAVDEQAGDLYAVSHEPTPALWRYALPPSPPHGR